jgi:hypothetical protein
VTNENPLMFQFRKLCGAYVDAEKRCDSNECDSAEWSLLELWGEVCGLDPSRYPGQPSVRAEDDAVVMAASHKGMCYEVWCGSSQEITVVVISDGGKCADVSPEITSDEGLVTAMKALVHVA